MQDIDDIIPRRKLPFTSPARPTTRRGDISVQTKVENRPGQVFVRGFSPLPQPKYRRSRLQKSAPQLWSENAGAETLASKRSSRSSFTEYEDGEPHLQSEHEPVPSATGLPKRGESTHLQLMSSNDVNERSGRSSGAPPAQAQAYSKALKTASDTLGLAGYGSKPVSERLKDLEGQMTLAAICSDDFKILCQDIAASNARIALPD